MNLTYLNNTLAGMDMLISIIHLDEVSSTNEYSKKNLLNDNTLVITSNQTEGKGRFGRKWNSSPGENLTFSLIKFFEISVDEIHTVNFYSSYILYLTIKNFLDSKSVDCELALKWPNDILLNQKKIAGILIDVSDLNKKIKKVCTGIGINVNQNKLSSEISHKATSLYIETEMMIDLSELLCSFIKLYYSKLDLINKKSELMRSWVSNTRIINKEIEFRQFEDGEHRKAKVVNIDDDGGLKVKFENGQCSTFYSGEISIVY